ncbi:MAG: pgl 2 [Gemmatimonadetes bacterium]|nr:pgl 2 [Gemmatimonadota bacterium]
MTIENEVLVYVGTYTEHPAGGGGSKGIYVTRLDVTTGRLGELTLAAELDNPSFVAVSPDAKFLYAVSEVGVREAGGEPTGFVHAYAIGADGALTPLNRVASGGADPCHINVSRDGRTVAVANYTGGSVAFIKRSLDGSLGDATMDHHSGHGPRADRQKAAHAHSVDFSPDDMTLFSCDLGADRVFLYRAGKMPADVRSSVALEPGSGPRHLALHPSGRYAYVIAELSNSVAAFAWNASAGTLRQMQTISTLPFGYTAPSNTAEIVVHPSGRFVYGSNRGHDSIASFSVDAKTGRLIRLGNTPTGGKAPRSFAIDPSGRWLLAANQLSDSIVIFAIDQRTGAITPTGATAALPRPVCVLFVPTTSSTTTPAR